MALNKKLSTAIVSTIAAKTGVGIFIFFYYPTVTKNNFLTAKKPVPGIYFAKETSA
jgi:hypothetical protein